MILIPYDIFTESNNGTSADTQEGKDDADEETHIKDVIKEAKAAARVRYAPPSNIIHQKLRLITSIFFRFFIYIFEI